AASLSWAVTEAIRAPGLWDALGAEAGVTLGDERPDHTSLPASSSPSARCGRPSASTRLAR
ncbi:MAG TPA: hypothetical protein VGO60_05645, partial [Iamia sp.]|nr:hypothetical protein [Iamia sp.]